MVFGLRYGMLLMLTPDARSIAYATRSPSLWLRLRFSSVGLSTPSLRQ